MQSQLPMSLFAVTIGINKYSNSGLQRLRGAVADAKSIVQFLTESGVPLARIRSLYDEQATREAIKSELQSLANNPVIKENDPILVYFAGHGNNDRAPSSWGNWDDEWVQSLLPYDFNESDGHDGVICGIPDRSLGTILRSIADAKGNNITVILDCCHSGSGTRCANTLIRSGPLCKIPIPTDLDNDLFPATVRSASPQAALPKFRHQGMKSHVLLAACKPEEVAHEEEAQGRFTRELLVTLRSLDIKSVTYLELIRCLKPLPSQNPQCEGIGDRLLFNNDIRSVKGYYRAKANNSSGGPRLQVEAGRIHGITDDTIFDVWADFSKVSDSPLDSCRTLKVENLSAVLLWSKHPHSSSTQTFIAKPQKGHQPTLHCHVSRDYEEKFTRLLESPQAQNLPFHLVKSETKDLADVRLAAQGERTSFELLAAEESDHRSAPRVLEPSVDILIILQHLAFYYHRLRHEHMQQPYINNTPSRPQTRTSLISMFDMEVYELGGPNDNMLEPTSSNLNVEGRGVCIFVGEGSQTLGFRITNDSGFGVFPYLFYFNSYEISIQSFFKPVVSGNQSVAHPLKANGCLAVGWGAGGGDAQDLTLDSGTYVESGFLKLYVTGQDVDLDFIEQAGCKSGIRGANIHKQEIKSPEFWGTIKIPFVLMRKPQAVICLLGTTGAKAPIMQKLASAIKRTDNVNGVTVHRLLVGDVDLGLADLPAFDQEDLETNARVCQSLLWFFSKHGLKACNALIFAHDILQPKIRKVDALNFGLVKDLCGEAFYKKVVIVTTNWHLSNQPDKLKKRESEVCARSDCFPLLDGGAQLDPCTSSWQALTLLSRMANTAPSPLGVQIEAKGNASLAETSIGATLRLQLHAAIDKCAENLCTLEQDLKDASLQEDVKDIKYHIHATKEKTRRLRDILSKVTRKESV